MKAKLILAIGGFFLRRHKLYGIAFYPYRDVSGLNIKILVTLPYREGCIGAEEFVAEDFGEEDIVGDVLGFEAMATEGAVGASEVAWFPRGVEGAEGGGNVLGELLGRWWC